MSDNKYSDGDGPIGRHRKCKLGLVYTTKDTGEAYCYACQCIVDKKEIRRSSEKWCFFDAHFRHYWERVGVDNGHIIYRCPQCGKCKAEPIEWLPRCGPKKQ